MDMDYDYIIAGQGIAGTVLGFLLMQKGQSVLVADPGNRDAASLAAGGVFNPVTGKRKLKTWKAEALFPYLERFYPQMEQALGVRFFYQKDIYKPFGSAEERSEWEQKLRDNDYGNFIKATHHTPQYNGQVHDPYGGFEITHAGYVEVPAMLAGFRQYLEHHNVYSSDSIDYRKVDCYETHVAWQGHTARRLIFCEGYKGQNNPWFDWLPFQLTKGELLEVDMPDFHPDHIINKQAFIVPDQPGSFRVGATYVPGRDDNQTTEEGRTTLETKLTAAVNSSYTVKKHHAGVRPAVKDRRPLIGLHPGQPVLGIFNGLGTKGVSLAPYFAECFYDFLEKDIPLEPEADIARFKFPYEAS